MIFGVKLLVIGFSIIAGVLSNLQPSIPVRKRIKTKKKKS